MNEATFLSALHESPGDEVTWLALADWLEEDGQPDRAELLRLTRQLRTLPSRRTVKRKQLEGRLTQLVVSGVRPVVPEVVNSLGMRFALIPPGRFRMGSPKGEPQREQDETAHEVEITRPYYLGVFPVTQRHYAAVMGHNPSDITRETEPWEGDPMDTDDFPVECVDWSESSEFCQTLSALPAERDASRVYRLPTEAEWEYACRAGTTSFTTFGDSLSSTLANFDGRFPYHGADRGPNLARTCPVGSYPPNAWGLCDMHGQVWEWCSDWYAPYDLTGGARQDPQGPTEPFDSDEGECRVTRGGAWMVSGDYCRSASRAYTTPDDFDEISGFRVVLIHRRGR